MGDPAGVGPEICLRVLEQPQVTDVCIPVVFGDARILHQVGERLGLGVPPSVMAWNDWRHASGNITAPTILDIGAMGDHVFLPGQVDARCGGAAFAYIDKAIDAALAGQVDAVTTGPINKLALHAAGIDFPGHTEILASRTDAEHACMMQFSDPVTAVFVTTHVAYREVPDLLSIDRILEVIQLGHDATWRLKGKRPRMAVCGLNPHAGENGLFGDEEQTCILPAIEKACSLGMHVIGPLPPDTAFVPARRAQTDCFVCMYHDQGHIPLKALAFDDAVNITLGLSIVRTSVDHGTAFDIAWQGKASPQSMIQALRLASRLASPSPGS